jgi:class 3 adenylate cyclase
VQPELPTGTVTFLFTDIEGSTRLLRELGDGYAEVLAEHRRALRESWQRYEGVEVDTQGDAFFVAFARASDAVAAAADAQRALACGPVRVRIGLHTGEPLRAAEGYVGFDVHRAARIAAVGHGGQEL